MTIFDQLRLEVNRVQGSLELDRAIKEGTTSVVNLIFKLIDGVESDTKELIIESNKRQLENYEKHIDSIISMCNEEYNKCIIGIKNVGFIAIQGEEGLTQEMKNDLYKKSIEAYVSSITNTFDLLLELNNDNIFYFKLTGYVDKKKKELLEVALQRKLDLGLEFPNAEIVKK